MNPRVTSQTFTRNAIHFTSLHSSRLLTAQKQITSGMQFELPSEEPVAYRQVRSLETRFVELQADKKVINLATSTLNASVAQFQDVSDLITLSKNLVQQGIQALDGDEREALATEIDALLAQAKQIGLAKFNENYLYGGTRSDMPPFTFGEPLRENGIMEVAYQGSGHRSQTHIGDSISIDTYYDGSKIFGASGREPTVLVGTTGAKHGGGTDTIVGRATLRVEHDTTTFGGGSGVAAGTSSAALDTILGPTGAHQLTIVDTAGDGSAGTISLNGADPVPFTNADTNLRVVGFAGQEVYLDTTNIAAGFNGTVNITSTGTLSVDDGGSTIPIDFSTNQIVSDVDTGKFVTIDSSNIRATGDDSIEFPGTSNLFQILHATAADLRNSRELGSAEYSAALNRRLDELDHAASKVFSVMGEQSSSLQTMQTMEFRVDDLMLSVESNIGEIQATDFPDAVLRLENSQTLLQYTYAVTANLNSLGLLEFLR
ncbi:flagellar hook-associated protein FlgL [Stieleria mannarensis]|uniref:flagellar hook-associated protein FlgL n=1 Tax=Stieleria mannarensis TaxID=2755585 RepID=UPI0016002F40|nr:flagellar hook-associated protein FlgL [Rhodopirellula sp. JC639]